jgi:hypothetical protein
VSETHSTSQLHIILSLSMKRGFNRNTHATLLAYHHEGKKTWCGFKLTLIPRIMIFIEDTPLGLIFSFTLNSPSLASWYVSDLLRNNPDGHSLRDHGTLHVATWLVHSRVRNVIVTLATPPLLLSKLGPELRSVTTLLEELLALFLPSYVPGIRGRCYRGNYFACFSPPL